MNKNFLFRTALCSLAAIGSACSNDVRLEEQTRAKQITMTASDFKYENDTRTSVNITPGGAKFTWAATDTVGIFPDNGGQVYFPLTNGAGANSAIFDGGGWGLKPTTTYSAYYPFIGDIYLDMTKIPVTLKGQTQTGNESTSHIGQYDYMVAMGNFPNGSQVNFDFKHLCSLIELQVTVPNQGKLTSVTLSSDEALFTTEGLVDLTSKSPAIIATAKSKSVQVNLQEITPSADKELVKVYFMMAPINMVGKHITATIVNNGEVFTGSVESKNLEAGRAYRLNLKF